MKHLFQCLVLLMCLNQSHAQEIVYLKEGTAIILTLKQIPNGQIGETIDFQVKYDIYAEDNLVVASESLVKGRLVAKNDKKELLVKVDMVHDLHGNKIKVKKTLNSNEYLKVKPIQKEYLIYVAEGFWFSY